MRYNIEIILIILNQSKKQINVSLIKRYERLSFTASNVSYSEDSVVTVVKSINYRIKSQK